MPTYDVTVYGFGPTLGGERLDPSGYVMKVLAFCIYNKIPFVFKGNGKFSPNAGRCPWAKVVEKETGKEINIEDSQRCITELSTLFNIDMDAHLTPEQKHQSEILRLLVENVLYHVVVRILWVDNKEFLLKDSPIAVPDCAKSFVINLIRKKMIEMLNIHGNGDLSDEESHKTGAEVYKEIARTLGDKKFLFSNEKPSTIDCVLYRYVDQFEKESFCPAALKQVFAENPNLAVYGKNVKETLTPDEAFRQKMDEGRKWNVQARSAASKNMIGCVAGLVGIVSAGVFAALKFWKWI